MQHECKITVLETKVFPEYQEQYLADSKSGPCPCFKAEAVERFKKNYNCCQSIICAYCEEFGVKEEDIFRLTEGFGLGMGGLKDTCGAVTGMFMTVGLANSAGDMEQPKLTKRDTYAKIMELSEKYKERMGSIYCRDLKTEEGVQPLPCCMRCVEVAAELMDEYFKGK